MDDASLKTGLGESALCDLKVGDIVQYERVGFARLDEIKDDELIFYYAHKQGGQMTFFTNGFVTLQTPKDFDPIPNKGEFVELSLVNPNIPMTIKFSTTPTMAGLPEIKNAMEEQLEANPNIDVQTADFIAINDDIYYMIISSISTKESQIRRNEFMYVQDNNLYSFEFVYPYADAELDDFYLNFIRSMDIKKAK